MVPVKRDFPFRTSLRDGAVAGIICRTPGYDMAEAAVSLRGSQPFPLKFPLYDAVPVLAIWLFRRTLLNGIRDFCPAPVAER